MNPSIHPLQFFVWEVCPDSLFSKQFEAVTTSGFFLLEFFPVELYGTSFTNICHIFCIDILLLCNMSLFIRVLADPSKCVLWHFFLHRYFIIRAKYSPEWNRHHGDKALRIKNLKPLCVKRCFLYDYLAHRQTNPTREHAIDHVRNISFPN